MAKRRMISFIYSSAISYEIEIGHQYMRFYYNKQPLISESMVHVSISTPYIEQHIYQLQYKQLGDVMWIVHPQYHPRKLKRTGAYEFELEVIEFEDGPFMLRNDLAEPDVVAPTTLSCSVTSVGSTGTLTASAPLFYSSHVGGLFSLTHPKTRTTVSQSGGGTTLSLAGKGVYTFRTRGTWNGTCYIERKTANGTWDTFRTYKSKDDFNVGLSWTEKENKVEYRIVGASDSDFNAELSTDEIYSSGVVKITSYVSNKEVGIKVVSKIESTSATEKWAESYWSDYRGWPASITFFEDRAVYAGSGANSIITGFGEYPRLQNAGI